MAGALYLVPTPIGNLEDITLRSLRILRDEVSIIACEDTRHTLKLLEHYQIKKRLVSYHEHNEASRSEELLEILEHGENIALVSDAGTPLLSDPGYRIVSGALKQGFKVIALPGPSAALTALAASGLAAGDFRFIGFFPAKAAARHRVIVSLADESATVVAYETPHRILETLADIDQLLGSRPVVLARELTKVHEEYLRGTAAEILQELRTRPAVKGEMTLLLGRSETKPAVLDPAAELAQLERDGINRMDAIKMVAKRLGVPKAQVYRLAAVRGSNPRDKHRD